jgi:RHS repeat-associated protein
MNRFSFFQLFLGLAILVAQATAQVPRDLTASVEVKAADEISNLDRLTQRIISSVNLTLTNRGTADLEGPFHVPVEFTTQGDRSLIRLEGGGLGGFGVAPYQLPYLDLTALLPQRGLPVGESVAFVLRFSRPSTLFTTYKVLPHGVMNRPPVAVIDGPTELIMGIEGGFSGAGSTDPDGDALAFIWDFGDGTNGAGVEAPHSFSSPGVYDVVLRVRDAKGLEATATRTVLVAPEGTFALGRTRALDDRGIPLDGVSVEEIPPEGEARSFPGDFDGYAVLGGSPGEHRWKFSKPGYLTVWRTANLASGQVMLVPSPWMTPLVAPSTQVSPLSETRMDAPDGSFSLLFPAGAFSQPGLAGLTALHGQTLPSPLPAGWSPLTAFVLDGPGELLQPAGLTLRDAPPAGRTPVLLRHDPAGPGWVVVAADGSLPIPAFGVYTVVIADFGATAPPTPVAGETLPGFAGGGKPVVTATGATDPAKRTASTDPALVTTTARVVFTAGEPLPSGRFFRTRVDENYKLRDGGTLRSPEYDTTFFAYQFPGDDDPNTLHAAFPLRPLRLFGPAELDVADLDVDVLEIAGFGAVALGPEGGALAMDKLRLSLPSGLLTRRTVAELRSIDPATLSRFLGGLPGVLAFQLGFGGGAEMEIAVHGMEPDAYFVLSRLVNVGGMEGLLPVLRLKSGADGVARSEEPPSGPRLPGLTNGGTYVLVRVAGPQGLVRGQVVGLDAAPRVGLPCAIVGSPWLAASGAEGRFLLVATGGENTARATDPLDGNEGETAFSMADAAIGSDVVVTLRETGPRVASVSPADATTRVRNVELVVVTFSEPLDAASFGPDAVVVADTSGPIRGSLGLDASGRVATFASENPFADGTEHTITIAATLRDRTGLALEGPREFRFTTAFPAARGLGAQLVIYEPGADTVPAEVRDRLVGYSAAEGSTHVVAHGSPGTADGDAPVILVNQSTGATATVRSAPDGSFAGFIDAAVEDFVTAVFVNANGTRVEVPATRQLFDDGRIGLYHQGGILADASAEFPDEQITLQIEPNAIPVRSVFRLESLPMAEVTTLTRNTSPEVGRILAGLRFEVTEGAATDGARSKISFPLDPAVLNLPDGVPPEDGAFSLALPVEIDGIVTYRIVDKLTYANGRVTTNSFIGLFASVAVFGAAGFGADAIFGGAVLIFHGTDAAVVRGRAAFEVPGLITGGDVKEAAKLALEFALPIVPDIFYNDPELTGSLPLAGAFITARPGTPAPAGRVRPGMAFYTSEADGLYNLILPSSLANAVGEVSAWTIEASHPRFSSVLRKGASFGSFFGSVSPRVNMVFPAEDAVSFGEGAGIGLALDVNTLPPTASLNGEIRVAARASGPSGSTPTIDIQVQDVAHDTPDPANSRGDLTATPGAATPGDFATETRRTDRFTSAKALNALIKVVATANQGGRTLRAEKLVLIRFGAAPPVVADPQAPVAKDDNRPPSVAWTIPGQNEFLPPGQAIVIGFSEPVNPNTVQAPPLGGGVTASPAPVGGLKGMLLSADKKTLTIPMPALSATASGFTLTFGSEIKDLAGNSFDQNAGTAEADSFSLTIPVAPKVSFNLAGVVQGGGAVMHGGYAYVADRGASPPLIRVFDLEGLASGSVPQVATIELPAFPRDLAFIPDWSFKRSRNAPVETKDLLLVVCGLAGIGGEGEQQPQILRVFDVSNPTRPVFQQGALLSQRNALINRVLWRAPYFAYVESGADFQFVSVVDLQEMMVGFNASSAEAATFGDEPTPGMDLNQDGDYVDQGEFLPLPERRPLEFFGKRHFLDASAAPRFGTIQDLDFRQGTAVVVMAGSEGRFKILLAQDRRLGPDQGVIETFGSLRPRRVSLLMGEPIRQFDGTPGGVVSRRNLALVSVVRPTGGGELWIIDLSNPLSPQILQKVELPADLGSPGGIIKRDDGLLVLAMAEHGLLLDLTRSASAPVVGIVPGAGTGSRTFAAEGSGLAITALGADSEVILGPPALSFTSFPFESGLVDPAALLNQPEQIRTLLSRQRPSTAISPARLRTEGGATGTLTPPQPGAHHHVLIRAPGAAGANIRVALEMMNQSYLPARNRGKNVAPVRALSSAGVDAIKDPPRPGIDAPIPELRAYRLSSDKTSPYYNLYLSDPFAVIEESVTPAELSALQSVGNRKILGGSDKLHALRACIDPGETSNLAVSGYAGRVDPVSLRLQPGAFVIAETRVGINLGNPPPVGGDLALPGTMDAVTALNGELRRTEIDLDLPSRRMPIVFSRTCAQATESEDFGEGWDHFYNQRLIERKEGVVAQGARKPLLIRDDAARHKVADVGDVEFIDGQGRVILFQKLTDESVDPTRDEVRLDPIWDEVLANPAASGTYYAPPSSEPGVFDILFKDASTGIFVRVTPEGSQFWYSAEGLLFEIRDKYDANRQVIDRKDGRITRITDLSVQAARHINVYRFRHTGEALTGRDRETSNARIAGKVCAIEDHAGRLVTYEYDTFGRLAKCFGFETRSGKGGFAGRPTKTYLTPANGSPEVIGVIEGNGASSQQGGGNAGTAMIKAATVEGTANFGRPVAKTTDGAMPPVIVDVDEANRPAANVAAAHSATNAANEITEVKFDALGYPKEIKQSGPSSGSDSPSEAPVTISAAHDARGRPQVTIMEEGNSIEYEFDTAAPFFRGRGNLLKITRRPGARGGPVVVTEFRNHDPLYNVPQTMVNPNGFSISMTLRGDKRDVETTDFAGAGTSKVTRNDFGQVLVESTPDGRVTSHEYDPGTGFLIRRTQGAGAAAITSGYAYAADPNSVAHLLGMPTLITMPHGAPAQLSYDNRLLLVKMTRGAQLEETGYDENGNIVRVERAVGGGQAPYIEERRYRQNNFLDEVRVVGVDRGHGQGGDLVTSFGPDEIFRVRTVVLPGGEMRELTYDHRSNVVRDKIGTFEQGFEYDLNGNMLKAKAGGVTVADFTYDGQDRRTRMRKFDKDGLGAEVATTGYFTGGEMRTQKVTTTALGTQMDVEIEEIDALGRPKGIKRTGTQATATQTFAYAQGGDGGFTTTITGPIDTVVQTTDAAGRVVSSSNAIGTTTVEYGLGNESPTRVTSVEDGVSYEITTGYNELDHPISRNDGVGVIWQNGIPRLDGLITSRTNGRNFVSTARFSQTGSLLEIDRAASLGLKTTFGYNQNLQPSATRDPANSGHAMDHSDGTLRLTRKALRDGSAFEFNSPDGRNNPTAVKFPGGETSTAEYDPQSRPLTRATKFGGREYRFQFARYDALSRLRAAQYGSVQVGAVNNAQFTYDPLGPLVEARYTEDGLSFNVASTIRADGARVKLIHPDGTEVIEGRDNAGRLTGLTSNGAICEIRSFAGAGMPKEIGHGGGFTETNTYDQRRRLTSRRYVHDGTGAVLADLRFLYDGADNVVAAQAAHRHGRADSFAYDAANRLTGAVHGQLPTLAGAEDQNTPKFLFQRGFAYDNLALDLLLGGTTTNPAALPADPQRGHDLPPFAATMGGHDSFLFARTIDGFDRGAPDALGQARATVIFPRPIGQPGPVRMNATGIVHNGLGHLEEITRADGVKIAYRYQPSGLLHRRTVTNGATIVSDTAYVWDGGRLIEERTVSGQTSSVRARYYYDGGDSPVAADLAGDDGALRRHHFLRGHDMSVIAVTDSTGTVVERVHYSAHGMPVIEKRDTEPPRIARVTAEGGGSLIVEFSEPAFPPVTAGPAPDLVTTFQSPSGVFRFGDTDSSATWLADAPGRPFGTRVRVQAGDGSSGGNLILVGGKVFDEWGNPNVEQTVGIASGQGAGTVLLPPAGTPVDSTAPERTARSSVGNPFLFHGQFTDPDTGLVYLRARWYDPFTGTFLQRDPMEFEDSVNLYAGMGNNPVSYRDPSGHSIIAKGKALVITGMSDVRAGLAVLAAKQTAPSKDSLSLISLADPYFARMRSGFKDYRGVLKTIRDDTMKEFGMANPFSNAGGGLGARIFWRGTAPRMERVNTMGHEFFHFLRQSGEIKNPFGSYSNWRAMVWEEALANKAGFALELKMIRPGEKFTDDFIAFERGGDEWLLKTIHRRYRDLWKEVAKKDPKAAEAFKFSESDALSLLNDIRKATATLGGAIQP